MISNVCILWDAGAVLIIHHEATMKPQNAKTSPQFYSCVFWKIDTWRNTVKSNRRTMFHEVQPQTSCNQHEHFFHIILCWAIFRYNNSRLYTSLHTTLPSIFLISFRLPNSGHLSGVARSNKSGREDVPFRKEKTQSCLTGLNDAQLWFSGNLLCLHLMLMLLGGAYVEIKVFPWM